MAKEAAKTIRTEVRVYRIELPCEEKDCNGTMESCAGMVLTTYPAQYPHKCTKCGTEIHISGVKYPYIEHKVK